MKLVQGFKKFMVCGIALASLASVGATNSSTHVSARHIRTTRVSHNNTNHIFHKMLNIETDCKHPSKSFEHQFMMTLHKFSNYQLYNVNGCQEVLNKHDKKVFTRIYNRKFNFKVNPHAKFNSKALYNMFIKESDNNDVPLTKQDKYNFMKMLPQLNYGQLHEIFKCNVYSKDNIRSAYGNKIGNAIIARYAQVNEARLDKKLAPIFAQQNQHISQFDKELAHDEFTDVNNVRKQHGLKPLKHSNALQAVANMRAPQALKAENDPAMFKYDLEQDNGNDKNADNLAHGFDSHETSDDDAHKLGLGHAYDGMGENESPDSIGVYHNDADYCGDPSYTDDNTTLAKIASNDVRDMMIYDKDSHNGHRQNILNKNAQYLAVATDYNPHASMFDTQMSTVEEYY